MQEAACGGNEVRSAAGDWSRRLTTQRSKWTPFRAAAMVEVSSGSLRLRDWIRSQYLYRQKARTHLALSLLNQGLVLCPPEEATGLASSWSCLPKRPSLSTSSCRVARSRIP